MNATYIQSALASLLDHLNLQHGDISVTMEGDMTRVDIDSTEASRIIGWHGETLNSLQHVLKSMIRTEEKLERTPLVIVDVDGYRKMQEEKVIKIAEQKADFVRRTGNRIALSPMSPYFRRIVHLYIANTPSLGDLTTESVGEGDYRQIVLRMKQEKKNINADPDEGKELSPVMAADDGLENLDI
jgi:spoIIIJ-associated protein